MGDDRGPDRSSDRIDVYRCTGSGSASAFEIVEAQPIREAPEHFLDWTPAELVEFLCRTHAGCNRDTEVTRIEWRYFDAAPEKQDG